MDTSKYAEKYRQYFEKNEKKILEDFFSFLKFQSISSDPSHRKDLLACSGWVEGMFKTAGFSVTAWPTKVNPVIFAEHKASKPNCPTILFYNHYDVQPVDPLELWESPPFDPVIKGEEVYARGASDNKGQCLYTMHALTAFMEFGRKEDLNIKVILDGEEEIGSQGLFQILEEKKKLLKSDYTLIVDLGVPSLKQPAVTIGFRGIITFDVECTGSNVDLHSGQLGGIAFNPLRGLTELLAKVWDSNGRVQINHFYDGVTDEIPKGLLPVDVAPLIEKFDLNALHQEKGYSSIHSNWMRPTFEINGLSGGYSGPGFKTVIPAKAYCKLSCRLVPGQDPEKIGENVIAFLKKNIAKGLDLKIELGHGAPAYLSSSEGSFAKVVKKAYEEATDLDAGFILCGGTLPIATKLAEVSQGETLGMGYTLDDDYIHAPNEHFGKDRLKYGLMTVGSVLELLVEGL